MTLIMTGNDNAKTLIMTGKRSSDNCYLWSPLFTNQVCHMFKHDDTTFWHKRLGHVSLKSIQKVVSKEAILGLPIIRGNEKVICGDFQARKQIKASHKRVPETTNDHVLELLHLDLMGLMQVESLSGKCYVMVCVNDFSRYTWVRFIKDKSETFSVCKSLCLQLQREKELNIVQLRSDHAREFENSQFAHFCMSEEIHHELSAPITPQQNGVVERKNRPCRRWLVQCFMLMLYHLIFGLNLSVPHATSTIESHCV